MAEVTHCELPGGFGEGKYKDGRLGRIFSLLADVSSCESDEDTLLEELFIIVEVVCKFFCNVRQKLSETEASYLSIQNELDATRAALQAADSQLKSCTKCADLEKELLVYQKRLQQNESRIKSIANILSLQSSQNQEEDLSSSNSSTVSRAFHIVSQMLLGAEDGTAKTKKRRRSDSPGAENVQPQTLAAETMKLEPNSPIPKFCVPETICPGGSEMFLTPPKQGVTQKEKSSPVLGSATKRILGKREPEEEDAGSRSLDTTWVSPSLLRVTSSDPDPEPPASALVPKKKPNSQEHKKKQADFWQLKTTHNVDIEPVRCAKSRRLKQAQLAFGCFTKKQDISSLKEFNGGIRPSQTSTQLPKKKEIMDEDEMLERAIAESLKERAMQVSDDDIVEKSPNAMGGRLKSGADSPDFKYRGKAVRKKAERQQLPGWDCDQCKKYFEAAGGGNLEQRMSRCSRHRDKFPIQPLTPKGYWDPDFPSTQECRARNMDVTLYDTGKS